ncbi:MAG TPA: YciI family protein [Candidatus Dormibacteraeota bacterium]
MKYILLINVPADAPAEPEMIQRHMAFAEAAAARGKLVGGDQLDDVSTATTLRRRASETIVTDGPYAETKEFLGGYYLIDAADLDEAIDIARGVPLNEGGSVEIRPVVER